MKIDRRANWVSTGIIEADVSVAAVAVAAAAVAAAAVAAIDDDGDEN